MIKKPVVLITGCSSGFGFLTAIELASEYQVIATMRDLNKQEDLKTALSQAGLDCDIQHCDVTDAVSINTLFDYVRTHYGRLDVLINNAGYAIGGFFEDLSEQDIRDVMETNFFALLAMTRRFIPLLKAGQDSKIINISSIAGLASSPSLSAYNASKWAVEGFSESLYFELRPLGISVVCIEPGPFRTRIFEGNLKIGAKTHDINSPYYKQSKRLFLNLSKSIPRLDNPLKVALLIKKVVSLKKLKFRYLVGWQAKLRAFLKYILPFSLYQRLVFYKLSKL